MGSAILAVPLAGETQQTGKDSRESGYLNPNQ
jgi:hypothetical protein